MNQLKYYFEDIIGFNSFIELRLFSKESWEFEGKEYNFFSKFASNYEEMFELLKKYVNDDTLNMYVGINPRSRRGRKIEDVTEIRNIVFDMEGEVKHSLDDSEYRTKLSDSVNWLEDKLKPYGLEFNVVVTSGRGIHCYCTFDRGLALKQRHMIKHWFNLIVTDFNNNGPHSKQPKDWPSSVVYEKIKIDQQVSDPARILGVPGTMNTKYKESSAKRKFLRLNEKKNNSLLFIEKATEKLEELKKVNPTLHDNKPKPAYAVKKYTEKSIFKAPEVRILIDYDDVPTGGRYTYIILAIKLLMKQNNLKNFEDVIHAIEANGYIAPKIDDDFPTEDEFTAYEYSESIFRRWCFMNWKWCALKEYEVPYLYNTRFYKDGARKLPMIHQDRHILIYGKVIDDWDELITELKEFNKDNTEITSDKVLYDMNNFNEFLQKRASPLLRSFIVQNKLENYLRYVR